MTVKLYNKLKELPISPVNAFVSKSVWMEPTQKTSKGAMGFNITAVLRAILILITLHSQILPTNL